MCAVVFLIDLNVIEFNRLFYFLFSVPFSFSHIANAVSHLKIEDRHVS